MESPLKSMALVSALGMYDWSLCAKKMLSREFFLSSLSGRGTSLSWGGGGVFNGQS
jgi:hypothetical protein